ncbi:MAG TPA: hypothetical protein VG867_09950 [Rhizomicrobium sp.]|nr:hypothetical protein [Rhizomicrobium sp.]
MEESASLIRLFVATPCYGGVVTQRYMQCVCALLQYTASIGISVQVELLGYESLITRGRNTLVAKFLDDPSLTHLMFIDADIGFETEQVMRMLNLREDVVAGMYPLKIIDWTTEAVKRVRSGEPMDHAPLRFVGTPCENQERERRDRFVTGIYAGTGFMLIRRNVFETMIRSYPHLRYRAAHTAAVPSLSLNQYALFDCVIDAKTGEYLSEDYAFCQRWRALGGKIWLDTASQLAHIGPHEFFGSPLSRFPATG